MDLSSVLKIYELWEKNIVQRGCFLYWAIKYNVFDNQ